MIYRIDPYSIKRFHCDCYNVFIFHFVNELNFKHCISASISDFEHVVCWIFSSIDINGQSFFIIFLVWVHDRYFVVDRSGLGALCVFRQKQGKIFSIQLWSLIFEINLLLFLFCFCNDGGRKRYTASAVD